MSHSVLFPTTSFVARDFRASSQATQLVMLNVSIKPAENWVEKSLVGEFRLQVVRSRARQQLVSRRVLFATDLGVGFTRDSETERLAVRSPVVEGTRRKSTYFSMYLRKL